MFLAAFIMGLVGSLHCALMCGPLVLAVPIVGHGTASRMLSRMTYHAARILIYGSLGAVFGTVGQSLQMAGLQRWLSLIAGSAMLLFLLLGRGGVKNPLWKFSGWVNGSFRRFLMAPSFAGVLLLGAANGLLPCGLVYMAGTASTATGNPVDSALFMIAFGAGTLPVMLGMMASRATFAHWLQYFPFRNTAVPAAVCLVALSLILRGLSLGIPYLSPEVKGGTVHCSACSHHAAHGQE